MSLESVGRQECETMWHLEVAPDSGSGDSEKGFAHRARSLLSLQIRFECE